VLESRQIGRDWQGGKKPGGRGKKIFPGGLTLSGGKEIERVTRKKGWKDVKGGGEGL